MNNEKVRKKDLHCGCTHVQWVGKKKKKQWKATITTSGLLDLNPTPPDYEELTANFD
jgi:hypothetical protein